MNSGKEALLNQRQIIGRDSVKSSWQPTLRTARGTRASVLEGTLGGVFTVQTYINTKAIRPRWDVWNKTRKQGISKYPSVDDAWSSHVNISVIGMLFAIWVKVGLPILPHPPTSKLLCS